MPDGTKTNVMKPYCKYEYSQKNKGSFMYLCMEFNCIAANTTTKLLKFRSRKKAMRRELKPNIEEALDFCEFDKFLKDYETD